MMFLSLLSVTFYTFMTNGFSHLNQLDEFISNWRVVR